MHPDAIIGEGTQIWNNAQIREGAIIGKNCNIGSGAYIGVDVTMGDYCKIENNACLFKGTILSSGVFVGPHVVILNDKHPSAVRPDGMLQQEEDWILSGTVIERCVSIGANATVLAGIVIHECAMIGAGAVVTKDVRARATVVGNPAKEVGNAP